MKIPSIPGATSPNVKSLRRSSLTDGLKTHFFSSDLRWALLRSPKSTKLIKPMVLCVWASALLTGVTTTKGQYFPFPPNFDPTDIPLMVMSRAGVDFEAEGLDVDELRGFFRERIAERMAFGGFMGGPPMMFSGAPQDAGAPPTEIPEALLKLRDANRERALSTVMGTWREKLQVADDAEWAIIQERIEKVLKTRNEIAEMKPRIGALDQTDILPMGTSSLRDSRENQARTKLEDVLEEDAKREELKQALDAFNREHASRKKAQALAQDELRSILTVRQEAIATLEGLL